ncbi:hypothetical protein A9P82_03910 [Arachidicoccus ginsenosidimutans]|nr:hypothetical protein A9P82_03910 [Arachidicoccus sp. BS20]
MSPDNDAASLQAKYATILNVPPTTITNVPLMEEIDSWYGIPYLYGGNSKDGIDCSAFAKMLLKDIYDEQVPRTSEEQYEHSKRIAKNDLREGDLVFFHTSRGARITHVGVYLQNNKFVHASSSGVMISDLNDDYWQKTYRGAGRVSDETDNDDSDK